MATTPDLVSQYNQTLAQPAPTPGLLSQAPAPSPTQIAPALYAAPTVTPTTYNAVDQGNITKWTPAENETVAGNLKSITESGSPLMQSASLAGKQYAQTRGLLSSSLGAEASQKALIEAATPIATSDATTFSRAGGFNAERQAIVNQADIAAQNAAKSFNAQAVNRADEFSAQQQTTASAANAQALNKAAEYNATNAYTQQQDLFQANVKNSLAEVQASFDFDKQMLTTTGVLSQEFEKEMTTINASTDMDQATKDYAVKQLFDTYKAQVSMLSAIGSIPDVSTLLTAAK
jgi:hypothetical protein